MRSSTSSRSGGSGPHRSGPRWPTTAVLVGGGDDAQHRHVHAGQPAVLEPQLDAPPPRRLGGRRADGERAVHAQVGVQRAPVVEAHQQVLAAGVGAEQHGAGEVDADEAGITRHAALAALAGEAAVDPLRQPADGVTLRHPARCSGSSPWRRPRRRSARRRRRPPARRRRTARARFVGSRDSTWSAPRSFDGGLPTPMRTRRKSWVWRWAAMLRSPLWPARPPPALTRTTAGGRSSSSWTIDDVLGSSMP